jgi:hypothetical protein
MEYIYKLKYKFLEVFIKWLLRYYTMVFVIFGRGWGAQLTGRTRYNISPIVINVIDIKTSPITIGTIYTSLINSN